MKLAAVLIACAMPLGACGEAAQPEVDARNASVAEVAEQVRSATEDEMFVRPGKWQSQVTVEDISVPGMPPEMAQQMRSMIAQRYSQGSEQCLTEENARRPKEEFFAGKNEACRYDRFQMGGGKIQATMRCEASGVSQVMQMDGTYSPDSYTMRMATRNEGGGQGSPGSMEMRMRVDSKRVGECDAKAAG